MVVFFLLVSSNLCIWSQWWTLHVFLARPMRSGFLLAITWALISTFVSELYIPWGQIDSEKDTSVITGKEDVAAWSWSEEMPLGSRCRHLPGKVEVEVEDHKNATLPGSLFQRKTYPTGKTGDRGLPAGRVQASLSVMAVHQAFHQMPFWEMPLW